MFEPDKIVVTAATLFGESPLDSRKAYLSYQAILSYRALGCEVVVVDGGSLSGYTESFSEAGAEVFFQENLGLGNGKREAVKRAYDIEKKIIVLTDLEKLSFAENLGRLLKNINIKDLLIPKRKNYSGYPKFQVEIETAGNDYWKSLTGVDLDMWFGPRIFPRDSASYFFEGDGDMWDAIFKPVIKMILDEREIISRIVCYEHDLDQSNLESGDIEIMDKRVKQLTCLTLPLREYLNQKVLSSFIEGES